MPWTFRRSKKIAPGVRVNLGRRDSSVSLGGRGAGINIGRRGVRGRVSLPGTGLSYRNKTTGCAVLLFPIMLILLVSLACGSSSSSTTFKTPTVPSAIPFDVSGFASGGLGLSRAEWEKTHKADTGGIAPFEDYDQGEYSLLFVDGNVQHLERNYRNGSVTPTQAKQDIAAAIPIDSQFVRTYHPVGIPELTVDLYHSASLVGRFTSPVWIGGQPGDFITEYATHNGMVARIVIATGNNENEPATLTSGGKMPSPNQPKVNTAANLRAGPGTNYPKVGSAAVGQALDIVARNPAGDWYKLASGAWIAAFLVADPPADVPVAIDIPTPPSAAPVPLAATVSPNAAAVTGGGQSNPNAFTCIGGCAVAPDPSCAIKGNVNSKGEKIYHTPGQRDYDKTDIKPEEGDRWFCTEQEAQAAGFRHAQR